MTKKIHNCTQQEHLSKIDLLLLGNGHPEDGFVFKVIAMAKDMGEIRDSVKQMAGDYKGLLDEVTQTRSSLATFKASVDGESKGKEKIFSNSIKITGVIVAFMAVILSGYLGVRSINKGQEELGQIYLQDSLNIRR